ncbi:hypothetical protein ACFQY7_13420 [Actinomadura luteofluorescens]|uniref:hypothetical protein n=1 Tax=Actinomadura luteofluorescens TaxID=46163 RepID=UPI00363E12D2
MARPRRRPRRRHSPAEVSAARRARDADTRAIREFNDHVAADGRVEAVILSIGDGVTLIRKRD